MSISYYYHPDEWEIKTEGVDVVRITVGEIEEYCRYSPINITMSKEIFEKIKNGDCTIKIEELELCVYENGVKIDII